MEYDMLRTMLMVSFMSFAFERGSECILLALFGLCLLGLVALYLSLPFSYFLLDCSIPILFAPSGTEFCVLLFIGLLVFTRLIIPLWNPNRAGVIGYDSYLLDIVCAGRSYHLLTISCPATLILRALGL